MSYWQDPKPVRRRRSVDVARIAREAAALLDDGGLPALTIRAIASRMGVAPASLYSRVDSAEDLLDLALDDVLGRDAEIAQASTGADVVDLMLALYRHLRHHSWAAQVIGRRAPRGPSYLQLSERMCTLLVDDGVAEPLATAYAMSNFVIGSAATAASVPSERGTAVDPQQAPLYARLHAEHDADPEAIVVAGLTALLSVAGTLTSG